MLRKALPRAPYLTDDEIRRAAESCRLKLPPAHHFPVHIELLVEHLMGIDIVPVPGLRGLHDTDGYLSRDLGTIYVDSEAQRIYPARYRFTLAHELGHLVLHKKLYEAADYTTVDGWLDFQNSLTGNHLSRYEGQAYSFAGTLLLPKEPFASLLQAGVRNMQQSEHQIDVTEPETRHRVASWVAQHAMVSVQAVLRQGKRDGHWTI